MIRWHNKAETTRTIATRGAICTCTSIAMEVKWIGSLNRPRKHLVIFLTIGGESTKQLFHYLRLLGLRWYIKRTPAWLCYHSSRLHFYQYGMWKIVEVMWGPILLDVLGEEKMWGYYRWFILMTRLRKPTRVAELSNVITKEWITMAGDDLWW